MLDSDPYDVNTVEHNPALSIAALSFVIAFFAVVGGFAGRWFGVW